MESITLGMQEFAIPKLRLGQIRTILEETAKAPGLTGGAVIDVSARIIEAGLSRSNPTMTYAAILDSEATLEEVNAAVALIIKAAGLAPSGEAQAPPVA